ncbi:MAG: hypothetical protein JW809_10335 [Pirellulales bacterium]|nr:hypothetical protein [Pirellulales bacterium]
MGNVDLTFSARIEQVESAMHRLEKENTKLIEQNRRLAQASRSGSTSAVEGMANWVKGLAATAAGYLSVHSAIRMVMAAERERAELAKKAQEHFAAGFTSEANLKRMMGGATKEDRAWFEKELAAMQARAPRSGGLDQLRREAGEVISATGAKDRAGYDRVLDILHESQRLVPDNPEERLAVAKAIAGMEKASGTKDPRVNAGYLMATVAQSRSTSTEKVATNTIPGAVRMAAGGNVALPEALALATAFSQAMEDPEGNISTQAAEQYEQQLRAFLPEKDTFEVKKGKRRLLRKGTGLRTVKERQEYLSAHPLEREEFTQGLEMRVKGKAAAISMAGGTPSQELMQEEGGRPLYARKYFEESLPAMQRPPKELARGVRDLEKEIAGTFRAKVVESQIQHEATLGKLRSTKAGMERAASADWSKEKMDELLAEAGASYVERTEAGLDWSLAENIPGGKTGRDVFEQRLRQQMLSLRFPSRRRAMPSEIPIGGTDPRTGPDLTTDPGRLQQAQILEDQLANMRRLDTEKERLVVEQERLAAPGKTLATVREAQRGLESSFIQSDETRRLIDQLKSNGDKLEALTHALADKTQAAAPGSTPAAPGRSVAPAVNERVRRPEDIFQ